ncbi:MAG: extracellular solute-binding protein [Acholeplasmataceae bacterium]
MKKSFLTLLILLFSFLLIACNGNGDGAASIEGVEDVTLTIGDDFDPLEGITATDSEDGDITSSIIVSGAVNLNTAGTYELTYKVVGSDGEEVTETRTVTVLNEDGCPAGQHKVDGVCVDKPTEEIVIMHGAPFEVDPFHENYTGTEQRERQERQNAVEEMYNVEIIYRSYPSDAAWGPDRVNAIIQSSVDGDHLADIYWSVSDWIQSLARNEAIVPVDQYLDDIGENIHEDYYSIGGFKNKVYGFSSGQLTADQGLYYNANLVDSLGVDNPTDLFLDGEWTWSRFETWATEVQTALGEDDMYALGGQFSYYAESMIPLNGGRLANLNTGRIGLNQTPALETLNFLKSLSEKNLFEPSPQYDAGSPSWMAGKVVMHPGQFWFINADNRWGGLSFELGFVPFPMADDYDGPYVSPVSGVALYHVASGMSAEREALVFEVWNELQLWSSESELESEFEISLLTRFDEQNYVDAYMEIYDSIYLEPINALGISPYEADLGYRGQINTAVGEGDPRSMMDAIQEPYQDAFDEYLE